MVPFLVVLELGYEEVGIAPGPVDTEFLVLLRQLELVLLFFMLPGRTS